MQLRGRVMGSTLSLGVLIRRCRYGRQNDGDGQVSYCFRRNGSSSHFMGRATFILSPGRNTCTLTAFTLSELLSDRSKNQKRKATLATATTPMIFASNLFLDFIR